MKNFSLTKLFIALGVFLTITQGVQAQQNVFPDLSTNHANFNAIEFAKQNEIIKGYPDGFFRPDQKVNRAEFAKIIMNMLHPDDIGGENCFPDVNDEWFAPYVCGAKNKGIITGYPDGTFRPGKTISFSEMSKILSLSYDYTVDQTQPWHAGYVKAVADKKAIPLSVTQVHTCLKRGEVTEILYRLYNEIEDKPHQPYTTFAIEQQQEDPITEVEYTDIYYKNEKKQNVLPPKNTTEENNSNVQYTDSYYRNEN